MLFLPFPAFDRFSLLFALVFGSLVVPRLGVPFRVPRELLGSVD